MLHRDRQGWVPDSISTDLHIGSMNNGMRDMLNVMSKFLNMGIPLTEVIRDATSRSEGMGTRLDLNRSAHWEHEQRDEGHAQCDVEVFEYGNSANGSHSRCYI